MKKSINKKKKPLWNSRGTILQSLKKYWNTKNINTDQYVSMMKFSSISSLFLLSINVDFRKVATDKNA